MCRHVAWLGRPRTVASLVLDPPSGLLVQSWAPRRQRHGTVNADGWGVGFYPDPDPDPDASPTADTGDTSPGRSPRRWRSATPLWGDASFASVAPVLRGDAIVAAVRSATVGMPADASAAAPFTDGRALLSHNGVVDRAVLPARHDAESTVDSALLAAHVFDRGLHRLGETIAAVGAADPGARLNVLATDGTRLLATTWGDTLSVLRTAEGVVLASEPYDDDPAWADVPDRHLVTVARGDVALAPLT